MIDKKFTEKIVRWLQSDHSSDQSIKEGATLLMQFNRDGAMFQRICRQPKRELKFLEYKLSRIAKMRQDGMTSKDVIALNNKVMTDIRKAVDTEPIPVEEKSESLPMAQPSADNPQVYVRKGIRPDHDKLPAKIQELWTKNAARWKKIKEYFETIRQYTEPCDRYELLKVLKDAWYKYKEDMARYDDYQLTADSLSSAVPATTPEQAKELANADSYISRYLPKLQKIVSEMKGTNPSDGLKADYEALAKRIQQRVDVVVKAGRVFTAERKADLIYCGIKL